MCLQQIPDTEPEKPRKGRYYCWSHDCAIEESEYAKHDKEGCDIQDMDFVQGD